MEFRCNAAPNAVPCVRIATTNDRGELLEKPKKIFKVVKNGHSVFSWIDRCSRKHFTAVDAEAKALNAKDYEEMLAECKELGIKVPPGTPFSVLADSLAKIEHDRNQKVAAKRPELLTIPDAALPKPVAPVETENVEELTNPQLKARIKDLGGEYPTVCNKAQLKEILSKLEADKEE